VNDDAVACRSEVDHFAYRCVIFVSSHDDGVARSWLPPLAVAGYPHWPGW